MKKFVLLILICSCSCFAQNRERKVAKDGHVWYSIIGEQSVGIADERGKTIIPLERGYTRIHYNYKITTGGFLEGIPIYIVTKDNKIGVCDLKGKVLIEPKFENATLYRFNSNGLMYYQYMVDGKVGVVDNFGNVVIEPIYESVIGHRKKAGDHFFVKTGGKEGVVDDHNRTLVECTHNKLYYSNGYIREGGRGVTYRVSNKLSDYPKNNKTAKKSFDTSNLYVKAGTYFENNEYKKAIKVYDKIIKKSPNAYAYLLRGKAYYIAGEYEKALESFRYGIYRDDCTPDLFSAVEDMIESADSYMLAKAEQREINWNNAINNMQALGTGFQSIGNSMSSSPSSGFKTLLSGNNGVSFSTQSDNSSSSLPNSSKDLKSQPKKINSQLVMSYDRSYGNYESQLEKMKSSGNYQVSEVRDIQKRMKEVREKYNNLKVR